MISGSEATVPKRLSPRYTAVMESDPCGNVVVVKLEMPVLRAPVPNRFDPT